MARRSIEARQQQFEISWFTKSAASKGIKFYESLGAKPVSTREASGKVWVTFRAPNTGPLSS